MKLRILDSKTEQEKLEKIVWLHLKQTEDCIEVRARDENGFSWRIVTFLPDGTMFRVPWLADVGFKLEERGRIKLSE